jgi:hypothetical protein
MRISREKRISTPKRRFRAAEAGYMKANGGPYFLAPEFAMNA